MEISSRVRPRGASVLAAFMAMLVAASFAYSTAPGPAPFSAPSEPGLLSHTNSTGVRYHAIPTDNPDDGKFLAIAGTGISTLGNLDLLVFVGVPSGRAEFELSIFDGELGGSWDAAGGSSDLLYRLYRDPLKSGSSSDLLASWTSASGIDDGWDVHSFATDSSARAPSGNYFYRLHILWEDPSQTGGAFNNFKIRATAQLGIVPGQDFGFAGGPQNVGSDPDVGSPDPNPDPEGNNAKIG